MEGGSDAHSPAGCEMSFPGSASACLTPQGGRGSFPGPAPTPRHGSSANYRFGWKRRRFNLISWCGGSSPAVPRRPRGIPRAATLLGRAGPTGPSPPPAAHAPVSPALMLIPAVPFPLEKGLSARLEVPAAFFQAGPHHPLGNGVLRTGKSCPGLACPILGQNWQGQFESLGFLAWLV